MSSSDVGVGVFRELTASGAGDPYGYAFFAQLTASGTNESSPVAEGVGSFEPLTAAGDALYGGGAEGAASFEPMSATAYGPEPYGVGAFENLSVSATAIVGTAAAGVGTFERAEVVATSVAAGSSVGVGTFSALQATSVGVQPTFAVGDGVFRALRAQVGALVGGASVGDAVFAPMESEGIGEQPSFAVGAGAFERLVPSARSRETTTAYRTFAMNVANEALTEYQGFSYNSFAEFGGDNYAAGPAGLFRLTGADDAGAAINWAFRTGFHDDKKLELKRLQEVLFAARYDGTLRLRVWTDENTYFDYNVANHRANVLHQVRAKLGKGLRSRYFRIEVFGIGNASAEIAEMNLPMEQTKRRLG